jgi:integral membrane sensor domain MASE1
MEFFQRERWLPANWIEWIWVLGFTVIYTLSAMAGLFFSPSGINITAIWPPLGIAVALIYLRGMYLWMGVLIGEILLMTLVDYQSAWYGLIILGNLLNAVIAGLILRNGDFDPRLKRVKDLLILTLPAGLSVVFIGGLLGSGTATLLLRNQVELSVLVSSLFIWVIGDYMSLLLFTPLIIGWKYWKGIEWSRQTVGEWLALITVLLGILGYIFLAESSRLATGLPVAFLVFPLLIWAGMRFRVQGVLLANFFITGMALIGLSQKRLSWEGENSPVLYSLFLLTALISGLFLAVINEARQVAESKVRRRGAFFRQILDSLPSGLLIKNASGRILFVNQYWAQFFGKTVGEFEGMPDDQTDRRKEPKTRDEDQCWYGDLESAQLKASRKMAFYRRGIPLEDETDPGVLVHMEDQTEMLEARERIR